MDEDHRLPPTALLGDKEGTASAAATLMGNNATARVNAKEWQQGV